MYKQLENSIKDKGRFLGAIISLMLGLFIVIVLPYYFGIDLLYNNPAENFSNYPRFLWCLAFCFFGFFFPAYRASKLMHDEPAWKSYPTVYLISLIIISCLVFAVLHISERTSNYLFYFLSSPICFIFSYYIDNVLNEGLIGILRKIR